MRLTREQLDRYERDGFLVLPDLFSTAEIKVLRADLPALFAEQRPMLPAILGTDCLSTVEIDEQAVLRIGLERRQSQIVAIPCRAVRAEDRVVVAYVDIDVRMIVRRGNADAVEFLHPDADLRDRAVVPELGIAARHKGRFGSARRNRALNGDGFPLPVRMRPDCRH